MKTESIRADRDAAAASIGRATERQVHSDAHSLDGAEQRHVARMLRGETRFSTFMWLNLSVAVGLVGFYTWEGSWSGLRVVLVLLILLGARSHLRHQRNARLLRRLTGVR